MSIEIGEHQANDLLKPCDIRGNGCNESHPSVCISCQREIAGIGEKREAIELNDIEQVIPPIVDLYSGKFNDIFGVG